MTSLNDKNVSGMLTPLKKLINSREEAYGNKKSDGKYLYLRQLKKI